MEQIVGVDLIYLPVCIAWELQETIIENEKREKSVDFNTSNDTSQKRNSVILYLTE